MSQINLKATGCLALGLGLLALGCRTRFPVSSDRLTVSRQMSSVERGRNLTYNVCGGCHYDPALKKFTGKALKDIPRIAGKVHAANITQSRSFGLTARYTDGELFYLIKTGINREGRLMPYMMRPTIADEDLKAIIAFLRSDDPAVTAADTSTGLTHLNMLGKMGLSMVSHPQPFVKGTPRPDEGSPVVYGQYLVGVIGCYHCHSKKAMSLDYLHPEQTKGYLAGGAKIMTPKGKVRGPNLTMDKETGIGRYTREQFRKAVQHRMTPEGLHLLPPMDAFPMTDQQADAIFAYLKSLPPVHNRAGTGRRS